MNRIICGVDVSKDWLDIHIRPQGLTARYANDPAGIAALAGVCLSEHVELVAMEASGGHERRAYALLWQAGLCCGLADARRVRLYAGSMGGGGEDRPDRCGCDCSLRRGQGAPTPAAGAGHAAQACGAGGAACPGHRRLTVQKQRRHTALDDEMAASLDEVIALLVRQSRRLEGEIASLIDDDPLWSALDCAFRSVKGVAGRTVARLMAELPEIGKISNKAIAKLAGLAPIANDSGRRTGRRTIKGGRSGPRSILFLVAAIAARYDPNLAAFQQRLQAAGKPKMVIRIALARKLLVILNAKARDARKAFANAA